MSDHYIDGIEFGSGALKGTFSFQLKYQEMLQLRLHGDHTNVSSKFQDFLGFSRLFFYFFQKKVTEDFQGKIAK